MSGGEQYLRHPLSCTEAVIAESSISMKGPGAASESKDGGSQESKGEVTDTTKPPGDQPKIQLYYFDMNGLGEPIRMALEYSGMKWYDYRFTNQQQFHALAQAGHLMFGEVCSQSNSLPIA